MSDDDRDDIDPDAISELDDEVEDEDLDEEEADGDE